MSKLEVMNAKYSDWLKSATFDNCKLNRKAYGEFLASYIIGEQDGFVLNLNGEWGTGKSEFLKRFYSHLMTESYPTIYIDAWESDFSKDPLTVVSSELLIQLELLVENIGSKVGIKTVKRLFGKVVKGAFVGLAGAATYKLTGNAQLGSDFANKIVDAEPDDFIDRLSQEYSEQIDAIQDIRKSLSALAEVIESNYGANLPVVVLVDELDRCRPTYAIEMLEVIKHFFNTPKFVFVVATDTDQLEHSIKAIYGNNFDSQQYLKRFFDRRAALPTPDLVSYLSVMEFEDINNAEVELFPLIYKHPISPLPSAIMMVANAFNLKIRDIDQLVNKFNSCIRYAKSMHAKTNKKQFVNINALLIALVEFDKGLESYSSRQEFTPSESKPLNDNHTFGIDYSVVSYSDWANLALDMVVKGENEPDAFSNNRDIPILVNNNSLRKSIREGDEWALRDYVNSVLNPFGTYHSQQDQIKYWYWDDIKKAVELSGYLE